MVTILKKARFWLDENRKKLKDRGRWRKTRQREEGAKFFLLSRYHKAINLYLHVTFFVPLHIKAAILPCLLKMIVVKHINVTIQQIYSIWMGGCFSLDC